MSEPDKKEKKKWTIFKKPLTKDQKLYLYTAVGCAAALLAIIIVAVVATNGNKIDNTLENSSSLETPLDSSKPNEDEKPVVIVPEGMISPIETVTVTNDYGFFHNKTLNSYYEHVGVDFSAAAGTEVLAVDAGKVESIFKDDLLSGTEIVISHGDGLKSLYRFVMEVEGLKVGDQVEKGDVIGTVAEATGDEYKDGAHLHFEVIKNGKNVDPAEYLTLEEK